MVQASFVSEATCFPTLLKGSLGMTWWIKPYVCRVIRDSIKGFFIKKLRFSNSNIFCGSASMPVWGVGDTEGKWSWNTVLYFHKSNFLVLKAILIHLDCTKMLHNRTRCFLLGLNKQPLQTRAFFFQKQLRNSQNQAVGTALRGGQCHNSQRCKRGRSVFSKATELQQAHSLTHTTSAYPGHLFSLVEARDTNQKNTRTIKEGIASHKIRIFNLKECSGHCSKTAPPDRVTWHRR